MSHCDTKNSQKVSHSDVLVKYNAMQNVQIFIVHLWSAVMDQRHSIETPKMLSSWRDFAKNFESP